MEQTPWPGWSRHLGQVGADNVRTDTGGTNGVGAGDTDGVDALRGGAMGKAMDSATNGATNDTTERHEGRVMFAHR